MIKAFDIMNTKVLSIGPNASVEEAVKMFSQNKISGLPVVDDNNKLIGILTERDIVVFSSDLHVIPLISSSNWISPYTDVSKISSSKRGYDLISKTQVEKVMTKKLYDVTGDASWYEIVKIMKSGKINHIPVVDNERKLIGIITRTDMLNYMAEHGISE
ncbi:HPP family protein [Anaerocolumna aminovalerica]|uniref:CBS domain-containing protein n=1 Tax=Anaerocolumna aminovalerica TaxID=1527 RepID=UPI000BE3CB69|nr:CBS domain-containing protein [Anaerocolumna aminovalerica]